MGGLTEGADLAGGHKLPGVGFKGGPPEATADELRCPVGPRMTGETAGVTPLEDMGTNRRLGGTPPGSSWVRWAILTADSTPQVTTPTTRAGGRMVSTAGPLLGGPTGEYSGKGVRPHVLGARALGQGEVKTAEEQGPARLSRAQPLRVPNVREVFVFGPYEDGVLGSLKPVPPLRQGGVDGQYVIILFRQGKMLGQERHRVDLLVLL